MNTPAINIDHWVDMDSAEFRTIDNHSQIRRFTLRAIELGAITVDKAGYIWAKEHPVHAEVDGKCVGLRYAAKAVN